MSFERLTLRAQTSLPLQHQLYTIHVAHDGRLAKRSLTSMRRPWLPDGRASDMASGACFGEHGLRAVRHCGSRRRDEATGFSGLDSGEARTSFMHERQMLMLCVEWSFLGI